MSIQIGDTLPDIVLPVIGQTTEQRSTHSLFARHRTVLFAVPGAFTPTCSNRHLPGYIDHLDAFRQHGIAVVCLAVNDAHVMRAWAEARQVPPSLLLLADGNGEFTRAMGLERDSTSYGMGLRAQRFAMLIDDNVVKSLQVEAPGEYRVSGAEAMLAML